MQSLGWQALCGVLLCLVTAPAALPDGPSVTLTPVQATLRVEPTETNPAGTLDVLFTGLNPRDITLRAGPLSFNEARGFVHFPDNDGRDTIRLDAETLGCRAGQHCLVNYTISDMGPPGLYQGTVEADGPGNVKLAIATLAAVRLGWAFQPTFTSSALHDGRLSVDVQGRTPGSFLMMVQNPAGAALSHVELLACPTGVAPCNPDKLPSGEKPAATFLPSRFWLPPGTSQTVSVAVRPCPSGDSCSAVMFIRDPARPEITLPTVISINQHRALRWRQGLLLVLTVIGALASLVLNNLFPTTRAKMAIRTSLERIRETLGSSPNAGPALLDALGAEATRLRLVVRNVSFTAADKEATLRDVHQAVAALATTAGLARQLSQLRTDADAALLPIGTVTSLYGKLGEAEEMLTALNTEAAKSRLIEAQADLTQARNDGEQAALRRSLNNDIQRLLKERGRLKEAPKPADPAATQPPPTLDQPVGRHPEIFRLIKQLFDDSGGYANLDTTDLLDAERRFYVADIWTEYMERKLAEYHGDPSDGEDADAWCKRKRDWGAFAAAFLKVLRSSPGSEQTQAMIDLLRCDTTLQDVADAINSDGGMRIACDTMPKFLEAVDVSLEVQDPVLKDVPAVRRIMHYEWSFGDDTAPPPDTNRCRHYFTPRRRRFLPSQGQGQEYTVSVRASVPFTNAQGIPAEKTLTLRMPKAAGELRWTNGVSFAVTAAIAVVTAFATKYGSAVPNVIGWSDWVTAFTLGFALDQLRDTVLAPHDSLSPPAAPVSGSSGAGGATSGLQT